jgi:hypothetical protein
VGFAGNEGGKAEILPVSRAELELGAFQKQVRIVTALENVLGRTVCRFEYIMHEIYKLLARLIRRWQLRKYGVCTIK